jgi:light-regulated signal transduction histidine kinase (bacteriophytochrome)
LRIALSNLLDNAWKFTSRCSRAKVEFGLCEDRQIYFVRDNGAGFDMDYLHQLFQPFHRLHATTEFSGTASAWLR